MTLSMPLRLIIEDDEGATTIVPLGKEAITIGRQQGNTIQLTEKNVSRTHARLFPESEAWMIEDLNSYNGIKVNDKPVDGRMKLREGDIVQIGDYHLAITEDVDKSTLNYDRPGMVANDGDPMLASSSADLPRLSPEEIHALSSGPQPVTPPPMMLDSGPVPALPYVPHAEPAPKRGSGLLIALGLLVLGGAAVGVVMLRKGGTPATDTGSASAATAKGAADGSAQPTKAPPTKAADVPAEVVPAGSDDAVAVVPEPEPEPAPETDDGDPGPTTAAPTEAEPPPTTPTGDEDPLVVDDDPPPVDPTPAVVKKKKPPKPTPAPTPTPPPVEDTGPSAEELLAQARGKGGFKGDAAEMYRLAKASYAKKASQEAAQLMGTAACRMGNAAKAKSAYNKLRGGPKDDLKSFCGLRGIVL